MLSVEERQALVAAVADWAAVAPDEPAMGFVGQDRPMTVAELAKAVANGTPHGEAWLRILEHGVRKEGLSTVVRRYADSAKYGRQGKGLTWRD